MTNQDEAAEFLYKTIMSFWMAPSLAAIAEFKIADALKAGPKTAQQIATATGTDAGYLRRLLKALASEGVFESMGQETFGPTAVSSLLCSDHPSALGHLLNTGMYGENLAAWTSFGEALRSGRCPFEIRHGRNCFEYLREHPERRRIFAAGMTATTRAAEEAIVDNYDFGKFELAVDIGGSQASLVGRLLERHPQAKGIVFDLPETVEDGRNTWKDKPFAPRLTAIGGNFFQSVPTGDLYLLKLILHDWNDDDCVAILKSIRASMRPHGRIAIIETVLPDDGSHHFGWGLDVAMMVTTGGMERALGDYRKLLLEANFQIERCTATSSIYSVVEAVAR